MLLIIFVELRVVAGRSRKRAGRPHAVSGWPMLIHTYHAMPSHAYAALCCGLEKLLSERHGRGMARAWYERSTACLNQTWPHCVNQTGKTHSKHLAAENGRGKAWARHGNGMVL
jgi:hypothetical protein